MDKRYTIEIEYSPAYELIVSLYHYIHHRHMKAADLDQKWREQAAATLPPSYAAQLQDERWEVLHRMVLLISQCPQKQSAEGFLGWLEKLPPGEIYERLAPWVDTIPLNLGEIRDRSLYLLGMWHRYYFSQIEPGILQRLQAEAAACAKEALTTDPIDLIETLTNGMRIEPTDQLRTVILAPQFHSTPFTILDFFRGVATCLYPAAMQSRDNMFASIRRMSQCLADEKRLEILHLLAQKQHSLIDLHKQLGLAKSTVHHHITSLRRAGMIRAHYIDHTTPAYYSLRPSFITRFHDELLHMLSQKRGKSHE